MEVIEKATYKPFGEQSEWLSPTQGEPESKGWIGERFDADAGLQYLNARYCDPELGMFLQPDWFEVTKAGVGTNRYSYSFNDPVNKLDPGGNAVPIIGIIVAATIGYFSSTDPANAPGPGEATLPPSGDVGLLVGVTGGGLAVSGGKIAAGSCIASPSCSNALRAYVAAETTTDVTGCASGDTGSCAAAAIPGVPSVGVKAAIASETKLVATLAEESVTTYATKQAAREALADSFGQAANKFFRDASKNAEGFKITDLADGGKRFEFFSPARNAGYGKRYVQEVDSTGAIAREFKETIGPKGVIETKRLHGDDQ